MAAFDLEGGVMFKTGFLAIIGVAILALIDAEPIRR
jgi:hypothetical protein